MNPDRLTYDDVIDTDTDPRCGTCDGYGQVRAADGDHLVCDTCDGTGDAICPVCFGAGGWQHADGLIVECRCGLMTGGAA